MDSARERFRQILRGAKPAFWSDSGQLGPLPSLFSYRRIWLLAVLMVGVVALVPLLSMAIIDSNITYRAVDSELHLRTSRVVSNAKRTISFYLAERKSALNLILLDNDYDELVRPGRLADMLGKLKQSFGGFVDLGVIDAQGRQQAYEGPYRLEGLEYASQQWFAQAMERGSAVSEVFLGHRNAPHLVIALRGQTADGRRFLLRATLDTTRFNELARIDLASQGDSFIINHDGVLQTPSVTYGEVLGVANVPVPDPSEHTEVYETMGPDGEEQVVGYAYIQDSPFILMVTKAKHELLMSWTKTRYEMLGFLVASILVIVGVVFAVSTFLVNRIYVADMTRVGALRQAEHVSKMASIGRLAAGVAHEINNPLAVIGEKAGLIKDLMTYGESRVGDDRLLELIDAVLKSVDRCATITRRLLGFARHLDVKVETFELEFTVREVLDFLHKEAEYRSIEVSVDIAGDIPALHTDRGKFQQVLLNLVNNAFAAMAEGGHLTITGRMLDDGRVSLSVGDDGCGIEKKELNRIFEPFFSTRKDTGGTGLGLSISYGLVEKMGGTIEVESELGVGSRFTIKLPVTMQPEEG